MVGKKYWSIGIIIDWTPNNYTGPWSAKVEFFDDGFCQDNSTQGQLVSRYSKTDLSELIDIIKADAEKLDIEWKEPRCFMNGDGKIKDKEYPTEWRKICDDQAERIGWKHLYTDDHIIIDAEKDKE